MSKVDKSKGVYISRFKQISLEPFLRNLFSCQTSGFFQKW